ncbi:hypothetical protein NBRC116584_17320 [Hydrogenophaga sp. 5NK40-0174]
MQAIVQRALEQTVNGVVVTDATRAKNPIVHVNAGFSRLTGYSADEVLGRNCAFLQGPDRDQPGVQRLRDAISKGESANVVVRNYRRDGSRFWNRVEMSPVRDAAGAVTHFFAVQTDVTLEREREEASLVKSLELERTISAHPLGMITLDNQGCVQLFSPACEALLGVTSQDVLQSTRNVWLHKVAVATDTDPANLSWPDGPGTVLWHLGQHASRVLEVSVSAIGELTGEQMVLLRDVTQQQVRQASRDHFLATAAHELRTPLGSIRGFSELMLMRDYGVEQSKPLLQTILKQSLRLGALLDDLLDLAQLDEKGQEAFALEPVELANAMRHACDVIELPGGLHSLKMGVEPADTPVRVLAHGARLEQVLINLLSNAVKYSPSGGEVTCSASPADEPGWWQVSVKDEGLGLSEEHQARLFTRFFRADPTGPIPGTGLGLAIVKEMVERMGGRISVTSTLGKGSCFTVKLRQAD